MKCEKCNKNEATFHSVKNINGKVSEKHLCSECAKNEKEFDNFDKEFLNFKHHTNSFFDDMMSDFNSTLSYFTNPELNNILDYDDFFSRPMLNQDKPQKQESDCHKKEFSAKKSEITKKLSDKEKTRLEIAKLDISLKKAVVEERYEDAVVIRDKIKELKKQLEK